MRADIPSLNWIRVFEAAARAESFARAAEELHMSTSAVSQQVKALETHLGSALFIRGSRHVELTDEGHAFLPVVRQSLNAVEETADTLFGKNRANTLRLQATQVFRTAWLAPHLVQFSAQYPDIQISLIGQFYDTDYQRPGSELRILFGPVHRSWGQCDRLFGEQIYPVARRDIARTVKSVDALLQHRLIQISTHQINWNQVLQQLGIDQVPARQLAFTDTTDMALTLASSGYGIALARRPTTDWRLDNLDLAPCATGPRLQSSEAYYLVYQNLDSLSPAARRFREWLMQTIHQEVINHS